MQGLDARPPPRIVPIKNRQAWRDLARILSTVFNPFLTALALFVILAHASARGYRRLLVPALPFNLLHLDRTDALRLLALRAATASPISTCPCAHEREAVFGAFVVFYLFGHDRAVADPRSAHDDRRDGGYTLSTLVVQYITRYWKISTHALGITAPLIALTLLYGNQTATVPGSDPDGLLGARLSEAHTLAQVIAGAALATVSTILFFQIFHVGATVAI